MRVTGAACERWKEHGGEGRLTARRVHYPLREVLRKGAPVRDGAVEVPLAFGLKALCVPGPAGWVVVTVEPQGGKKPSGPGWPPRPPRSPGGQ